MRLTAGLNQFALVLGLLGCARHPPNRIASAQGPSATVSRSDPPARPPVGGAAARAGSEPARSAPGAMPATAARSESSSAPGGVPREVGVGVPPDQLAANPKDDGVPQVPHRVPDVIFVPTPGPVVDRMLALAEPRRGEILYDLGCGDGRIVVAAAKRYAVKAFGFDIDPDRVAEARQRVRRAQVEALVTIERRDIFELDLSPADVVTLYLLPELNLRLLPQLQKLKPGARIVSHDFGIEGIKPERHLQVVLPGVKDEHEVFLWRSPLRVPPTQG
jgi:protein-L-isoaspartate O-methyltransferase